MDRVRRRDFRYYHNRYRDRYQRLFLDRLQGLPHAGCGVVDGYAHGDLFCGVDHIPQYDGGGVDGVAPAGEGGEQQQGLQQQALDKGAQAWKREGSGMGGVGVVRGLYRWAMASGEGGCGELGRWRVGQWVWAIAGMGALGWEAGMGRWDG